MVGDVASDALCIRLVAAVRARSSSLAAAAHHDAIQREHGSQRRPCLLVSRLGHVEPPLARPNGATLEWLEKQQGVIGKPGLERLARR
jgi:hypothetical protein